MRAIWLTDTVISEAGGGLVDVLGEALAGVFRGGCDAKAICVAPAAEGTCARQFGVRHHFAQGPAFKA